MLAPREEVSLDDALRSVGECGAGQAYIFGLVNTQCPRVSTGCLYSTVALTDNIQCLLFQSSTVR